MGRARIDDNELFRLLVEQGRSQREAAAAFGVTEAAVSKRVKLLRLNLPRHVGLERAKAVADHGLNVVEQLELINRTILEELEWATTEARKPKAQRKGYQEVIIGLTSEVRKQLGLQLEILRALYSVHEVASFQQEVLDVVGQLAPEARQTIIARLHEKRALRSVALPAPAGA